MDDIEVQVKKEAEDWSVGPFDSKEISGSQACASTLLWQGKNGVKEEICTWRSQNGSQGDDIGTKNDIVSGRTWLPVNKQEAECQNFIDCWQNVGKADCGSSSNFVQSNIIKMEAISDYKEAAHVVTVDCRRVPSASSEQSVYIKVESGSDSAESFPFPNAAISSAQDLSTHGHVTVSTTEQQAYSHAPCSMNLNKPKESPGSLVSGKPYLCPLCGRKFAGRNSLKHHLLGNCDDKPCQCDQCLGENPGYPCPQCGKLFAIRGTLKVHIRTHTGEKPYICQLCGKRFTQMCSLDRHMGIHNGKPSYHCPQCGKGFSQKGSLERHKRSHVEASAYQCELCGKTFPVKDRLELHIRAHNGEKPYRCQQCEKRFPFMVLLEQHMRSHTGEKPFRCSQCGKGFSQSSNLNKHIRVHSGVKPYQCPLCEKSFSANSTVKEHLKIHAK